MKNLKLLFLLLIFGLACQIQICRAQEVTADEYIKRAQAAQAAGDFPGMIKNASGAIDRDQSNALAYFLRGIGEFSLSKYAEAVSDSAKVSELNPNVAEAYFLHGTALTILRPDDWKISLEDFNKAIRIDATFTTAFRHRARIHNLYDKDYAAALADAGEAVRLDPKYADGYFERGRANQNLQQLAAAESDYSTALTLGKNSAEVYDRRGVVYFLQNKRDPAIADFRAALALDPDDSQAKENLELALSKTTVAPANPVAATTPPSAPAPPSTTRSNMEIPLAFANANYEKVMPAAEEIFKKLTTHRYPAPKEVSYMGRTDIVDPFSEDKNKLAVRINSLLQAQRSVLDDRNASELTADQRQLCQERLDKIVALQTEAARRHLVTLEREQ